ncbi:MAG TPA: 3-phosphoshikimate 1-carboxyvinyltransferase [Pyrinomonadaceae bacterium]
MIIRPAKRLRGGLRLPGDKSVSHRAAILAALARGETLVGNFSTSEDCASTLACLNRLGVETEREGTNVRVKGVGPGGLRAPGVALDCDNSGSTMRMLAGVLAGQDFESELTGDDSLRSRPMKRIIEPLELMGARVESAAGRAPLRVRGRRPLQPISYRVPVASAQVKSCLLLAGLSAGGRTEVIESGGPTRDHTERMLRWLGVPVEVEMKKDDAEASRVFAVQGPAGFDARDISVPGDISSAAFFIAAASLLPGSDLRMEGVGLNPTRARIVDVLRGLGAQIQVEEVREECNEPVGTVRVKGSDEELAPQDAGRSHVISGGLVPQLIDELPVLAVVGTRVRGGLTIRDAAELRVKESDRLAATAANLRAMGAVVEEHEDGLTVSGPSKLRGARLDSYGDHRITMAFAVAALLADDESEIAGAEECVGVSFPEFFGLLESAAGR